MAVMQTTGADVLPLSTQGLELQITPTNLQMQSMEGRRERSVHRAGCEVWVFCVVSVVCWFNFAQEMSKGEGKQPPPEGTVVPGRWYKKCGRVTCPPTGRDVRHWQAGKCLKWGCCAFAEANRHTGHVSLPGIYPHISGQLWILQFSSSQHPLKPRAVWLKWEGCDFAFQLPSIASNWTCRGERLILSW